MITPGPSDASAIFALLTAISTPETAKASLQEILKATEDYQTLVESSQTDLKKIKDEIEAKVTTNKALLDNITIQKSDINDVLSNKQKQLDNSLRSISKDQAVVVTKQAELDSREKTVKERENAITARETALTTQEKNILSLANTAQKLKSDYEAKLTALRSITNN